MNATPFSTRYFTSGTAAEPAPTVGERALVLGGGGAAGNAWLIGVVAGLFDAGLDVTQADLTIGTSAGSTAAAQLAGSTPTELLDAILTATPPPHPGPAGPGGGRGPAGPAANVMEKTAAIFAAAEDPADLRRRLGAALEQDAASDGPGQARWRTIVSARLTTERWPQRRMLITAVDARTGEPVVFDRHSGVDLVDAVAASCAGGFAYGIGDSRFIDGGYRRGAENADLAVGYGRVLVLSPLGGRTRAPLDWGMQLAVQVDELRAGGSRVETILPDSAALEAFGSDMMRLSARLPAARAGYDQGKAVAGPLAEFWR